MKTDRINSVNDRPRGKDAIPDDREWISEMMRIEQDLSLLTGSTPTSDLWERLRVEVFNAIRDQMRGFPVVAFGFDSQHKTPFWYLTRILRAFRDLMTQAHHLIHRNRPYLFWCDPRRRSSNGVYFDVWNDPLIDSLPAASVVSVEPPWGLQHSRPAHTRSIVYLDVLLGAARLLSLLRPAHLSFREIRQLTRAEQEIVDRIGVHVPLLHRAVRVKSIRRWDLRLLTGLLRWLCPKVVFLTVSYARERENLVEAARALRIVTVELQHGTITDTHSGYSFPGTLTKRSFPDHLLVFGNYWKENTIFPITDNRVHVLGYPYLALERQRVRHFPTVPGTVTFITQGLTKGFLAEAAVKLAESTTLSVRVKLHPNEINGWKTNYPSLWAASRRGLVTVFDSGQPTVHSILAESESVVGGNSTALYEAVLFGCRIYVMDLPGWEYMEGLIECGCATLIHHDCDLEQQILAEATTPCDPDSFFELDWRDRFERVRRRLRQEF